MKLLYTSTAYPPSMGGALRTNGKFGGGSIIGSFRRILSSDTYLNVIYIFIIMSI